MSMNYKRLIIPVIILLLGVIIEFTSLYNAASTFERTSLDGISQVIGSLFGGYVADFEGMPQGRGGLQGGLTYDAAYSYAAGIIIGGVFVIMGICGTILKSNLRYLLRHKK